MTGKYGYTVENINGTNMFVAYAAVNAVSATWAGPSFEPFDSVFSTANSLRLKRHYNEPHSWWRGSINYSFIQ